MLHAATNGKKEQQKQKNKKKVVKNRRANSVGNKAAKKKFKFYEDNVKAPPVVVLKASEAVVCMCNTEYIHQQCRQKIRLKKTTNKANTGGGQMQSALSVRGQLTYCMAAQSLLPCRLLFSHTQTNGRTDRQTGRQAGRQLDSKVLKDAGSFSI